MTDTLATTMYNVVIAGDLTRTGDRGFRYALEAERYAQNGSVGLINLRTGGGEQRIAQELAAVARRGIGQPVDPAVACHADTFVLHGPSELNWADRDLSGSATQRLIIVVHHAEDYNIRVFGHRLPAREETIWAPVSSTLRELAPSGATLHDTLWLPPLRPGKGVTARDEEARRPAIGWIVSGHSAPPPYAPPLEAELFTLLLDGSAPQIADEISLIDLHAGHLSLQRLVRGLSAIAFFPDEPGAPMPDALIGTALQMGRIVVLPPALKARYGAGPIYCEPADALREIAGVLGDAARRKRTEQSARRAAARWTKATDSPRPKRRAQPVTKTDHQRPVIFVAGGNTGIGHVTRLLAVARKMAPGVPILFVCQTHAVSAIEKLGYAVEFIPSASQVGGERALWDLWLRYQLERIIDDYDPALVVFDGNHPYPGLVKAVASRPDCRFAWVRRGLWGKTYSRYMANARWFDTIIEPGELEGQPDEGVTASRRAEVLRVPPILLIEKSELLSRPEAAKVLGLDPTAPAVLIQIGVNTRRDTAALIDTVVAELRKHPRVQICVAEFSNGGGSSRWPGVIHLQGFPLSQYIRAFDFAVSAAGYNTFHEAIGFAVPTIFVANRDPSMDDQAGRAEFAQSSGAAFALEEDNLSDLPSLITLLLQPKGREYLAQNCEKLALPNGAQEAAAALSRLMEIAP